MRKILALIFMVFLIAGTAVSENKMITEINASGGGAGSAAGNSLQMIFGVPWGGETTVSGNTMRLSILWGTSIVDVPDGDAGFIKDTKISKTSDGKIKLTWDYMDILPAKRVKIYRLSGPAKEFTWTATSEWGAPIYTSTTDNVKTYTDTVIGIGDEKGAYYRIVPSTVSDNDIFGKSNGIPYNERTVGKTDVITYSGYNFISMPMISLYGNGISENFFWQFDLDGVEVYSYNEDTGMMSKAKYSSGEWKYSPNTFNIERGKSYWVKRSNIKAVSLLGAVSSEAFSKGMLQNKYLTLGAPFPVTKSLSVAGLSPRGSDEIYYFNNNSKLYSKLKSTSGRWVNAQPGQSLFDITPAKGYWYRNVGELFDWTVQP